MRIGSFRALSGLVGLGLIVGSASAASQFLVAVPGGDQLPASYFTLSFGPGVDRQALISRTDFTLEVDSATGIARFRDYSQDIDSLELPGGIPTGAIHVAVAPGTSSGTFTGSTFNTTETYNISFANDLSIFGLTSPVGLPGNSGGTVSNLTDGAGRIDLAWSGIGQLQNPADPGNPIVFGYNCSVVTRVVVAPACANTGCTFGDIDGDCRSGLTDLAILLGNFGVGTAAGRNAGDVNVDGAVDLTDLALMLNQFGNDCSQ